MPNSINITNNLTSTSIPELYIRYFNPKININTDIIIPYYVSDSTQEEFLRNTNTKSFTTIVKIGNNTFSQTTNAGEYSINIGSISTTGETYFSIYTIDENGVASIEQFFDILIIDSSYAITPSQTYTMVESDLTKYNITVGESVSNTIAQSNNTGLNNLFNDVKDNGYRKIIMLNRIYMLDYHGDKIMPPTEFTVDMNNATFKATQCTDINVANLVDLRDCFDTHVVNGNLVGNYDGFDFATTQSTTGYYIPGEGLAVAEMNGARYSSFENMDMSYSVGYNLGVFGGKDAGYVGTAGSLKFSNAYYINGNNTVNSDVLSTTDLIDITGLLDRGEIQCSVYLNYGGFKLNRAELFIHFYNSSNNYMTTVKTRQYQMVKIPNGATQVRVTGFTTSSTDNSGLSICHTGYSKNCELINIKSHNTRTCAMHPGIYNHLLIKDCTFNRVADENEYKVTKLALDFEDGYENGRNLFFINNEVYEGTSALTIQRCFNANIIGCRNFGLDTRGHIKGAYIKNNFFNNGDIYTTNFDSQSHLKLINNTFFKTLNFLKWDDTGNYDSIGLTELDCKNGYTNNKNCTLFIRNENSSGGSGDSGGSGGTDTPSSYTITNNLTNCTTNNNNESVSSNSNYTATITANSGYVMASIVVTMGGADISDTAVSGNNINISNVTGNIVITAVASEQAEVLPNITLFDNGLVEGYTISNGTNYTVGDKITLSHGSNTYFGFDQAVTFNTGDSINFIIDTCSHDASDYNTRVCYLSDSNKLQGYETSVTDDVISANLPYKLTHTFTSKTTIRPALMKYFGNITVSKVYVIRAGNSDDTTYYSVVNNLTNCTTNNNSVTVSNNSSYSATITANDGYTISSITVTMGGEDITSNVVSGNNINISNVTGNIVITANTSATYTITRNVTNCTSTGGSSIDTSITTTFQSVVAPNDGYTLETLTVSMGGVDYTNRPNVITDMEWNGKPAKLITIENVSGNIVITASAIQQSTPPTGGGSGGDTGGDSGELTYTSAVSEDFTTLGDCDGISIDSSNNLVASTLAKWGAVKLNKDVSKLQFNVRDTQADHGALCLYIYNTYKDGAMDMYNMIALSNVAGGENGKLFKMDISTTYSQQIGKLDIPAINPGEQLTIEITDSAPTTKQYEDGARHQTIIAPVVTTTQTIKRADGTILTTLTGNMSAWCGQSTNSSPFCSNIKYVPEVVYDNPSYSVKDYKITLSQDGYSEVFDANNYIYFAYCENSKEFVGEDGEDYALALFRDSTGSKFRINGMCPSAWGYRLPNKEESEEPYDLTDHAYVPTINNFNFSVTVRNGDLENQKKVDASLLEDCISTLNCALPAFNYSVDSTSKNELTVDTFNETWYGLTMTLDDHFVIRLNEPRINEDYGTPQSSTVNYKSWKGLLVHELGHTLGFDDNASHYPTLYTYGRDRAKVNYLQAPDIFTLKSLYKEKYNIDISKSQEDIDSQVTALGLGTSLAIDMPSDRILSIHFDYPMFTNDELYDKSDLIIEGKLEFDRCESINIGSENSPLILEYNIYKIIPNSVIKGEITNYELKIHVSEKIDIGTNNTYKLYLKQFENTPCSLVNIKQGIIEL